MTSNNQDADNNKNKTKSPKWGWTTKLVVGLALVALAVWLLVQFQHFLGPMITAFILAYLIHPIAKILQERVKLPWRLAVTLIYIVLVLGILGLLTWGGFALVDQIQNLIRFIENNIDRVPDLVAEITTQTYEIGPFEFTPSGFNWDQLANEVVGAIRPIVGRFGSIASSIASGAASIASWTILILLVSYFLLAESEGIPSRVLNISIPDYKEDIERLGSELARIWNAFIRGEILVVFLSLIIYTITLGGLQLQFFFGLAVIASIGQLIPYVGAWVTWLSFGLVALFQANIPYNLLPGVYMLIVLGVSMIINNVIDNILRTKVMSENLKVHPVLVLIGALVGVQLFGFIGIVVAAPIMASLKLFLGYVIRKLNDQNPWKNLEVREPVKKAKWLQFLEDKQDDVREWFKSQWKKVKQYFKSRSKSQDQQKQSPGED